MPEATRAPEAAPPTRDGRDGVDHVVACPGCGEATRYTLTNPYRPFCSARCQGQDFGAWASEHYRMGPSPHPQGDDDA